jgi:hypothetical protein
VREFILFLRGAAVLGYQILARLLRAAVAPLCLSAVAAAGTIEGTVTFPSQLAPSMTVYASDVDTSRVHSVQLARGQANFTLEVPAGRYLVFLAPNEPGAPDIYGAYTQYSLCASHQSDGGCEDHTLVPVIIAPKTPHAAVTIDDWYLTDDIAEQIDRIRGVAAAFYSEPLSAPRFSEYPSAAFDASAAPKIDFGASELSEEERANVQQALLGGPNFAGHVTATLTRCVPSCGHLVLVDWLNGTVQELPSQHPESQRAQIQGALPCRTEEALLFRRDSRLLSVTRARGAAVVTQYYVWNQKNAAMVLSAEYQRTAQAFCAVAAR